MTASKGNRDMYRFKVIHDCLRGKTNPKKMEWDKVELASACDDYFLVAFGEETDTKAESVRKTDLKNLKNIFNAPIEQIRKGKNVFYKYSNPHFTFNADVFFDKHDWESLLMALGSLKSKIKNEQIQTRLEQTLSKLTDILSFDLNSNFEFILFENADTKSKSHELLKPLIESIQRKKNIALAYRPRYDEITKFDISPYLLKEFKNQWYVIGLDIEAKKIKSFALDRVHEIAVSQTIFVKTDSDLILKRYRHILGITYTDGGIEKIVLRATRKQYPYFESLPIHWSQKVVKSETDFVDLELSLMINYELKSLILSYSRDVQVLSPLDLVDEIRLLIKNALLKY